MNNFKETCFYIINDLFKNRPKVLSGNIVKYDKKDRDALIANIKNEIKNLEENKNIIDSAVYNFLSLLYKNLLEFITNYKI